MLLANPLEAPVTLHKTEGWEMGMQIHCGSFNIENNYTLNRARMGHIIGVDLPIWKAWLSIV